jgi:hypothetical protein
MIKYILLMVVCSGIPGNECNPIPTPIYEFDKSIMSVLYMVMTILVRC